MWHRLISALAIVIILLFVWQEVKQGRAGIVPAGVVKITSNTDAQVYVDNQSKGTIRASQPRVLSDLKPGRHIIGLSALGFKSKNIAVMVQNGQQLEQAFNLETEAAVTPSINTVGFKDLAQSLESAEDGAVLFLAAGEYQLSSNLEVQKSISLIGAGLSQTRITSSLAGVMMRFSGSELHLKGISFVHTGKQKSDVVSIEDAKIKIEDCRFSGGYSTDKPRKDGDGLWLHGHSSGSIVRSHFENNSMNGLEIQDSSNIRLEHNELTRNDIVGLSIWNTAKVEAFDNTMFLNKKKGVQVSDQAWVRLVRNKITFNTDSGISFFGSSSGTVENNTLIANQYGLEIMGQSTVSVSKNLITKHQEAIYTGKNAHPTIGQNTFLKNDKNLTYEK
jgi:parallel beta-helix repeat protein